MSRLWCARRPPNDAGSVTAEFAVALPAVLLVLALGAATLAACARQVRLQDAAADAVRLVARGDGAARARDAVQAAAAGAVESIEHRGGLVCLTASAPAGVPLMTLALSAQACALNEGE